MKTAEIVAVGSELLIGGRLDTNSIFLSERLAAAGVEVRFKTAVGDDQRDILEALRTATQRADVVVITGGLGPTRDDCTREAMARLTGRPLRRDRRALEGLRQRLAMWGRPISPAQLRQAAIPTGAEVLPNPVGSAPGFLLSRRGCLLIALPGVPAEAEAMVRAVLPRLRAAFERLTGRIERRVLHTFGLPEAVVEAKIGHGVPRGVRLGLLASPLGVTVSLTAGGRSPTALDRAERLVRRRLAPWIYAEGEQTMEEVVGGRLGAHHLMLAVAESCTGGLIGHRLTEVAGSSRYLERVVVSYSNRAKTALLGVPEEMLHRHGAVSPEVAAAMAAGVRSRSGVQVGLSTTGVAGPDGGTPAKPVGLVYIGLDAALPGPSGKDKIHRAVQEFRFHGTRQMIKLRASQAALNLLRQWLGLLR